MIAAMVVRRRSQPVCQTFGNPAIVEAMLFQRVLMVSRRLRECIAQAERLDPGRPRHFRGLEQFQHEAPQTSRAGMLLQHSHPLRITEHGNEFDRRGLETRHGDASNAMSTGELKANTHHRPRGDDHCSGGDRRGLAEDDRRGPRHGACVDVIGMGLSDAQIRRVAALPRLIPASPEFMGIAG